MTVQNILFLDTGNDSELKLNFSLHMAGFRVLTFRTFDEAINWGTICSRREDTLCILINAQNSRERMKEDLRLYRNHAAHLPVVWIGPQNGQLETGLSGISNLVVCTPEELPVTLNKLLRNNNNHRRQIP